MNDLNMNSSSSLNEYVNSILNEELNKNVDFNNIYQKFIKSFTFKENNLTSLNIDTIRVYIASKSLIYLPVFLIESEKLKYCFDMIKQYKHSMNDFSFISEGDIIYYDSIIVYLVLP